LVTVTRIRELVAGDYQMTLKLMEDYRTVQECAHFATVPGESRRRYEPATLFT
jgi:hypothetical protein